eukprot:TRINITY_DN3961_c0_g2_i1.p1 TRINITY_DN3961_c0_g2~~TRINITY_DN3961_c0_g2_i1.p1  ORF type:complete len:622 (+),score=106.91 TRINITY_DN3961_c0_g2_i1:204-1868(+)
MDVVEGLRAHGAVPFVVFDGGRLPAKQGTEEARKHSRETARWRALALLRAGTAGVALEKAVTGIIDITPEMGFACLRRLQTRGVECIVAPCEADAQLAHLALTGRVDVCVSCDVDLLAYGCQRVVFNLQPTGWGREIRLAELGFCRGLAPYSLNAETLPDLCVLTGCDYLPPIRRMGVKKASNLLYRSGGSLERAVALARRENLAIPPGFEAHLRLARLVYRSQIIFDPSSGGLRPLRPLPKSARVPIGHLGPSLPDMIARGVAVGELHPITLTPFAFAAELVPAPEFSGADSESDSAGPVADDDGSSVDNAVELCDGAAAEGQIAAPTNCANVPQRVFTSIDREFKPPRFAEVTHGSVTGLLDALEQLTQAVVTEHVAGRIRHLLASQRSSFQTDGSGRDCHSTISCTSNSSSGDRSYSVPRNMSADCDRKIADPPPEETHRKPFQESWCWKRWCDDSNVGGHAIVDAFDFRKKVHSINAEEVLVAEGKCEEKKEEQEMLKEDTIMAFTTATLLQLAPPPAKRRRMGQRPLHRHSHGQLAPLARDMNAHGVNN